MLKNKSFQKTLCIAFAGVLLLTNFCLAQSGWMEGASTEFGGLAAGAEIKTADLPTLIGNIISIILGLLGVVLILLIIYSGFLWMTAGGETKQVDKAQAYIKNAVIGLVVILLAYAITQFVIDKLMLVSMGQ